MNNESLLPLNGKRVVIVQHPKEPMMVRNQGHHWFLKNGNLGGLLGMRDQKLFNTEKSVFHKWNEYFLIKFGAYYLQHRKKNLQICIYF